MHSRSIIVQMCAINVFIYRNLSQALIVMVGVTLCHLFKYTNYMLTGPLYVQYRLQQRSISLNDYWHFLSNGLALHYITFSTFIYAVDGFVYHKWRYFMTFIPADWPFSVWYLSHV